jgi:excinuclease ABC subunit C
VDKADDEATILSAFIGQFYENKPPPRLLLCSHTPAESELLA